MKGINPNPAQRQLVHRFIDWGIVDQRLQRFPAIGRAFPLEFLRSCQENPPYYCHYMAWRLGTWKSESFFLRLDELLAGAERLPCWSAEGPLLKSAEFSDFWSLVWQLQVAEYLCSIASNVQWALSGPDLSAQIESETWYIECYTYRKSFGLMLFIEELLRKLDGSIRIQYDLCMPFRLSKDHERIEFLNRILSDFTDSAYVESARSKAKAQYPVLLLSGYESDLVVYMEGPDPEGYMPGMVPNCTGDPDEYLKVALGEALRAKQNTNSLANRRPNLVAVNFSLSVDAQLALNQVDGRKLPIQDFQLGASLDALAIATLGIDERLERSRFRRIATAVAATLALDRLTYVE